MEAINIPEESLRLLRKLETYEGYNSRCPVQGSLADYTKEQLIAFVIIQTRLYCVASDMREEADKKVSRLKLELKKLKDKADTMSAPPAGQ